METSRKTQDPEEGEPREEPKEEPKEEPREEQKEERIQFNTMRL